ncbi:MAG: class I SAM-dependent methyltransferase [Pyrinomonadaceae bacterium]|nr:class I SAM-dependent methyltransferase [Pyrinomonadaceae bacterium]MCX7640081.1 class I SAM-dependent methyltransferase [Pyrinomonadaceae bacterium]MDW8304253.1 class I SAM-dependent methyltransferase [Acidobacteriota bacterium]
MNCPICGSQAELAFSARGFPISDCSICRHRFVDFPVDENFIREVYSDAYFTGGGAGYADYLADAEILRERGRYYARLASRYVTNKKLLDVGAAAGFVLQGFVDEGWQGSGIEINKTMARYAREKLNLTVFTGSFENFQGKGEFSLISMIQVVAHFYDLKAAFQNAHSLLSKNGVLLIETWNFRSITARIFGRKWHEYSPPSVLHWFSPESLTGVLSKFGFVKIAQGRPKKVISGRHARSLLHYLLGKRFFPVLKLIPDRIRIIYPAEDLFWALYRKK